MEGEIIDSKGNVWDVSRVKALFDKSFAACEAAVILLSKNHERRGDDEGLGFQKKWEAAGLKYARWIETADPATPAGKRIWNPYHVAKVRALVKDHASQILAEIAHKAQAK